MKKKKKKNYIKKLNMINNLFDFYKYKKRYYFKKDFKQKCGNFVVLYY